LTTSFAFGGWQAKSAAGFTDQNFPKYLSRFLGPFGSHSFILIGVNPCESVAAAFDPGQCRPANDQRRITLPTAKD
jgi:hypothetical protein